VSLVLASLLRRVLARPLIVFLIAAAFFAATTRGRAVQNIDTQLYVEIADDLSRGDTAQYQTTATAMWTVVTLPSLIAVARSIAPAKWPYLMVLVNVLCAGGTAALLASFVRRFTRSDLAAAAALVLYVSAFDVILWVRYVLADTIYASLSAIVFMLSVQPLVSAEPLRGRRFWLAAALIIGFFTRPTGVVVIPFVLLTEFLILPLASGRIANVRRYAVIWLLLIAAALAGVVVRGYLFHDIDRWPFEFMRPKLAEYADREKGGEVVWGRKAMNHPPTETPFDHIAIEAERFVRFFQITVAEYSRGHNVVNVVYYTPLYLLAAIGVGMAWRRGGRDRLVAQAALLWILGTATFIAVTILDYDWRYRLPVMPQFIMMAAYGFDRVVRRAVPAAQSFLHPSEARDDAFSATSTR
jgi:hypothetical protein